MQTIAIVVSYGRRELCDLLAMWERQTVQVPLFVWLDDAPHVPARWPAGVVAEHAERTGDPHRIGETRRLAVERARELFDLGPDDAFMVLDDDDYYHRNHCEETIEALGYTPWTGARRVGMQTAPCHVGMITTRQRWPALASSLALARPELGIVTAGGGPGFHACWAMRFALYDAAGGYRADEQAEDCALAWRIGWQHCIPHDRLTHVRRQYGPSLYTCHYDRALLRSQIPLAVEYASTPLEQTQIPFLSDWVEAHK